MKMGFPGDIPPPANHSVYLEILEGGEGEYLQAEGKGSPPTLALL